MDENGLLILLIAVSTGEMADEGNVDKQVQLDPQLMVMFTEHFHEQVLVFFLSYKFVV